ncbi:cyclic nucleotide-gated cation channel subunit A [Caerostris extrusa]|uniref:Cyclic nucleotide-gated cation channel subunit A n=1 Tax=Caerostris extrusa TaxID=172846 RepID=A0AAV4W4W4_CAEEX|nr:cyclic nucleotide-gated cation channel subunit A [Caerostris extrusa]
MYSWDFKLMRRRRRRDLERIDSFLEKFTNGPKPADPVDENIATHCWGRTFVVDPSENFHYRWLSVISMALVYNVVMIVGRSVFLGTPAIVSNHMVLPRLLMRWYLFLRYGYTCPYRIFGARPFGARFQAAFQKLYSFLSSQVGHFKSRTY